MPKKKPNQPKIVPAPPAHLSERSKQLWIQLVGETKTPGRQALLQTALESLDRADECRNIINVEGLTVTSVKTGLSHSHPLLKVEKESRQLFTKIMNDLKLLFENPFQ